MRRVILVRPRAEGGLLAHVREEARLLARSGVRVVDAGESALVAGADSRASSSDIHYRPLAIASGASPFAAYGARRVLRAIVREELQRAEGDPLTVHAHGARAGAIAALALTPMLRSRVRLVTTLHNRMPRTGLGALIGRSLFAFASRRSALVLAVSPDLADAARTSGARAVERAIIPAPSAEHVSERVPRSSDVLEVVCIARLAPQKDLACLCEAVRIVNERHPGQLRVRIAGEGPERQSLESRIAEGRLPIELLGRVSEPRVLMGEADLVVQTSAWEGQPVALQEAIGEGAAIIATDAGGTRWVTGEQISLIEPGDSRELAKRLTELLPLTPGARARLEHMREASRARAAELPTESNLLEQLENVLFTDTRFEEK